MAHTRNVCGTTARRKMVNTTHKIHSQLNRGANNSNVVATHGAEWGEHLKKLKNANRLCKENKSNCEELKKECVSAKKFLESIKEDPLRLQTWQAALETFEKFLTVYTEPAIKANSQEMKVEYKINPVQIQRSKSR